MNFRLIVTSITDMTWTSNILQMPNMDASQRQLIVSSYLSAHGKDLHQRDRQKVIFQKKNNVYFVDEQFEVHVMSLTCSIEVLFIVRSLNRFFFLLSVQGVWAWVEFGEICMVVACSQ